MIRSRTGLLLVLCCLPVAFVRAGGIPTIDPQTLAAWLNENAPPLLVDVRGHDAYRQGTIVGALNAGTDPAGFLPDSRGGVVVLIANPDQDLKGWHERFADYGYRVYRLRGGPAEWRAAGLPLHVPKENFVKPGTVPFVIPRGLCELNEPAEVFD